MEEQIIKTLLEVYKERGVDLNNVINDSMFKGLPLASKIAFLKNRSEELVKGSTKYVSKEDLKDYAAKAITNAAVTGTLTGIGAITTHSLWSNKGLFEMPWKSVGKLGALAGLGSLGVSAITEIINHSDRKNLYNDLERVSKDPTDSNALRVLINNQGRSTYTPPNPINSGINKLVEGHNNRSYGQAMTRGAYEGFTHNVFRRHDEPAEATADEEMFRNIAKAMKKQNIPRDKSKERNFPSSLKNFDA